jgi:adenine-specific DNA-methyltransferase
MLRHKDKRANIPTDELRAFVAEDEAQPNALLYPRDPSLDPQLVWKGKDEQDKSDLAVPIVPIYIQEKLHPRVIIENLRDTAAAGEPEPELSLFDDFNGIEFEQLVDFYQHEQNWSNRLILGDSLLVMNSLAEKEGLKGKVQTIYFDPPYGIKFGSNWQVSTRKREVKDGKVEDATRQPEQVRAFRDTWELGIHSYLAYLRDRLTVARELLTDTGSLFVQMSDTNLHLVRCLLDEVFGAENFVSQITFQTTSGFASNTLATLGDFLLWYAKDADRVKVRHLYEQQETIPGEGNARWILLPDGTYRGVSAAERRGETPLPEERRLYKPGDLQSQGAASGPQPFEYEGKTYTPGTNAHWKANYPDGMQRLAIAGRIHVAKNSIQYRRFADDFPYQERGNIWRDTITGSFTEDKVYVVQTNTKVIERCLLLTTDPGDLVIDPTCGGGTTALASERLGRRWITIDTSRVALALTRARLMGARLPSYVLKDSPEGQRLIAEQTGQTDEGSVTSRDVRQGFVNRRLPHITLRSIANNPDIEIGMNPAEVDTAIARHADPEEFVDQPHENPKAVRVVGPFTVESLSPHRVLDSEEQPISEETREDGTPFASTVLENLGKAGVQNTVRQEHLDFDWLEPFAGSWVHARGEFTDADGTSRTVAVSIGPEHGTVGTDQVKEAAKEALKGAGVDLLLLCAFAFDAHAGEIAKEFQPDATSGWAVAAEEKRIGKLPVLLVRMNPDLAMGDELLKKTGAGNLFMVFGEPDIAIEREDGQIVAEVRGVDVYDPTTGQVRSSSVDDIACWMIDTNYNGESFFVRHAYFTGAEDPYKSLKRALKADIDEEAWESLYRTRSRPFDPPSTKRIAVKVINHYGDEVMKTYSID